MYNESTCVLSSGPPPVITCGRVKTWKYEIMVRMRMNELVRLSSGSVMYRNEARGPAPSMRAAS